MFIGREKELNTLEELYKSNKFELVVVSGRRRMGKTALTNRFIEGKNAIYFMGIESTEKQNLEIFSQIVIDYNGADTQTSFASFQAALEYVFKLSESERLILVIDEYPLAAHSSKGLAHDLQMLIDKCKGTSKLMLILCGLSDDMLPFGDGATQIELSPLTFEETCCFMNGFVNEEIAMLYGALGGVPRYLRLIDNKLSFEKNIKKIYLDSVSPLWEEPLNLLNQEIREPALYTAMISAIANGASRMSEISEATGLNTNYCATYLKSLVELGIVQKETPYGEESPRKTIYSVADNMFRFWFRFVMPNSSAISRGDTETVYNRIQPHLSDYMVQVFEDICKQYLWKLLADGNSPVHFSTLGKWWGNASTRKKQIVIDIIGEQDKDTVLLAKCSWTDTMAFAE